MALSGMELLPCSVVGHPLAVCGKLLPGAGGWAEGRQTGILVGPFTGDGE